MLFNSYIFMLLFLPLALAGYYICGAARKYEWGKLWLTAMSLWFYAWFNVHYLPIIVGSILGNYGLYRVLLGDRGRPQRRRRDLYLTAAGVAANLGVLFYYKYFDFFVTNINLAFHADLPLQHVLLPLGISFFTFQQVGFLVDTYRGETKNDSFIDYALFVTFFPQLIAGPIVTHDEMIGQFQDVTKKKWNEENVSKGVHVFVCGLAKKVLVADMFGRAVSWGFENMDSLNGLAAVWMIMSYSVQLYFDFSGYCDMARGIGLMFNIEIPVNFLSPYKAVNMVDFWKRWHMTLTRFFTKYVYIPLGGNRKGKLRTYGNLFLVYLVSGIWHGAGWTFVCWGALHGGAYVLTKRYQATIEKLPRFVTWAATMICVQIFWVFFRADSIGQALQLLGKVAGDYTLSGVPAAFAGQFRTPEFFYLFKLLHLDAAGSGAFASGVLCDYVLMFCYMAAAWIMLLCCRNGKEKTDTFRPTAGNAIFIVVLYLWSLVSFSEVSTFLYFNF